MSIARHLLRPTREFGRAILKHSPIWSCTGWGLQSFPSHLENWCALTAPFHPYPETVHQLSHLSRRYIFCCTFLRVAATPCYGAPCPVVFGLSSGQTPAQRSFGQLRPYRIILPSKQSADSWGKTVSCQSAEVHCAFVAEGSHYSRCIRHRQQKRWPHPRDAFL